MKIVQPKAEVWGECPTDYSEAIDRIERAGRVCYRSEDKIVEGSSDKFVANIVKRGHLSVIEHSNFVLRSKAISFNQARAAFHSRYLEKDLYEGYLYIGGNFRAWMELLHLPSIISLYEYFEDTVYEIVEQKDIPPDLQQVSVWFLTDRAVTHELVRHRPAAMSMESQRYCAYRNELEVVLPFQYSGEAHVNEEVQGRYMNWRDFCIRAESTYQALLAKGERAEEARSVLPNCTAARLVVTATTLQWWHIFNLRTSTAAYPGIRNLLTPVKEEFVKLGWA